MQPNFILDFFCISKYFNDFYIFFFLKSIVYTHIKCNVNLFLISMLLNLFLLLILVYSLCSAM